MSRYFDDFNTNDEILHYGVKGMKWRKRLARRLTKSALEDNRKAKEARYNADDFSNWRDNKAKENAAISSGRDKYKATHQNRIKGRGFTTGQQYTNPKRNGNANKTIKQNKEDMVWLKEKEDKERKKHKRYSRSEKVKTKLAKIIGGK